MRRKFFAVLVIGWMILPSTSFGATYGGGSGTAASPYLIYTAAQMNTIGATSADWSKYFKLMADIDMSAYTGTQYKIIGNSSTQFTGTFDGNGHVISNLTYTTTEITNYVGVFGRISGTIKNLGVENVNISTNGSPAGGLVASTSGTITNCYSTGTVSSFCSIAPYAGGLAGGSSGTITNCYSRCTVLSSSSYQALFYAGGLVGSMSGTINNCYSTGLVTTSGIGYAHKGGLVGYGSNVINCFWDTQTSGCTSSSGGKGRTTAQMKQSTNYIGWNTTTQTNWTINEGMDYPRLSWECQSGTALSTQTFSTYISGTGTTSDPYYISTAEQLNIVGLFPSQWSKVFCLKNNIDLTGVDLNRIGTDANHPFSGTFNGNNFVISNLTYLSQNAEKYVGLFGYTSNATIKNLGVKALNIAVKSDYIGGIAGCQIGGTITNCYTTGTVNYSSSSTNGSYIGGLVGNFDGGAITNSYCTANVTSTASGNLVFYTPAGSDVCVGGLVGYLNSSTITNCYSTGSVGISGILGDTYAGGFAGELFSSTIINCYSTSPVGKAAFGGGLIGYSNQGTVTNSFWDTQTSGKTTSFGMSGEGVSPGGTGKTTAQMQTQSTFTSASWDFNFWNTGIAGNALKFDGVDDYVKIPAYNGIGGSHARTVSLWIKTSATGVYQGLVQWGSDAAGQLWYMRVQTNGTIFVSAYAMGVASNRAVTDNQWHHIAAVLDEGQTNPTQIRLYIDGQLDAVPTGSGTINTTQTVPVYLGVWYRPSTSTYSNYFAGLMDDVCIYNRALDASEILPAIPVTAGLAARWTMDQTQGGVVADTISSYNGTFKNGTLDAAGIWYMNGYPHFSWEAVNPLQTRIDAASNGEIITVQPGVYQGTLDFKGKNITLTSTNPQDSTVVASTIIRGLGTGPVISFKGTETSACILQGFTIENGNGNGIYGGAACSAATIRNCVIRNNNNAYNGGGIANCSGLIANCILRNNTATTAGSAMYQCNGQIVNCTIVRPSSPAISLVSDCAGSFTNCILAGTGTIFNNCTGPITYSCYPGAYGTSNISVDPLFINAAAGDYHLLPDSPCNDAGDPASDCDNEPFPNGSRVDMGAYGNTPEATNSRDGLVPLGFVTVNKTRAGRTSFEYELAVTVHNSNAFAMTNVQMKLKDWDTAVQSVSDDSVTIDTIPAGATVTSTDTFKIIVDRSTMIASSRLTWELTYYVPGGQVQQAMMSMPLSEIDANATPSDITGDGYVNLEDFAVMAVQWNAAPGTPSADIALPLDNYVGIEDLIYLAENWMK